MAQAKIETTTREVVKVQETEKTVSLTLSVAEATVVMFLVGRITGPAINSPRGLTDSVYEALEAVGVRCPENPTVPGGARAFTDEYVDVRFRPGTLDSFKEMARLKA